MNSPLKVAKDTPSAVIDWDATERQFSDVLLEAKALKVKIAEHLKRPIDMGKIDEYSNLDSLVAEYEKKHTEKKANKPKLVQFEDPETTKQRANDRASFELKGDHNDGKGKKQDTSCCTLI